MINKILLVYCILSSLFLSISPTCDMDASSSISNPVIIGGIGDSGTRGVRNLFELLGVRMCPSSGLSGDDDRIQRITHHILFSKIFPQLEILTSGGNNKNMESSQDYFSPETSLYPGSSVLSKFNDPYRKYAEQIITHNKVVLNRSDFSNICNSVLASYKCAAGTLSRTEPSLKSTINKSNINEKILWGFKEPRTALFVSEWKLLLGPTTKFVHVIRDGRDVALGDLKLITAVMCSGFFEGYLKLINPAEKHITRQAASSPIGQACKNKGSNILVAWALLNEAVADEAFRLFGTDNYLLVRIEDIALVSNPAPTLLKIIKFLEVPIEPPSRIPMVLESIMKHVQGYSRAYGGNKFGSEAVRQRLIQKLQPGLNSASLVEADQLLSSNKALENDDIKIGVRGSKNHEYSGDDIVFHALRRFGYKIDRWGLEGEET